MRNYRIYSKPSSSSKCEDVYDEVLKKSSPNLEVARRNTDDREGSVFSTSTKVNEILSLQIWELS